MGVTLDISRGARASALTRNDLANARVRLVSAFMFLLLLVSLVEGSLGVDVWSLIASHRIMLISINFQLIRKFVGRLKTTQLCIRLRSAIRSRIGIVYPDPADYKLHLCTSETRSSSKTQSSRTVRDEFFRRSAFGTAKELICGNEATLRARELKS